MSTPPPAHLWPPLLLGAPYAAVPCELRPEQRLLPLQLIPGQGSTTWLRETLLRDGQRVPVLLLSHPRDVRSFDGQPPASRTRLPERPGVYLYHHRDLAQLCQETRDRPGEHTLYLLKGGVASNWSRIARLNAELPDVIARLRQARVPLTLELDLRDTVSLQRADLDIHTLVPQRLSFLSGQGRLPLTAAERHTLSASRASTPEFFPTQLYTSADLSVALRGPQA